MNQTGCGRLRSGGLIASIALAVLILVMSGGAAAERLPEPVVTPSQQITKDLRPGRGYTNAHVLVHPDNPNIMVIAHADFSTSTCVVHVSRDAGRTWAEAPAKPVPPQYKACSRPAFGDFMAARFGVDGTLYFASTGGDTPGSRGPTEGYVARSTDLGETWRVSVVAKPVEREFTRFDGTKFGALERFNYARLATHPTDPKRLSVGFRVETADAFTPAPPVRSMISVSTDGGVTWSKPVDNIEESIPRDQLAGSDAPAMVIGTDGAIMPSPRSGPLAAASPSRPSRPPPPRWASRPSANRPRPTRPPLHRCPSQLIPRPRPTNRAPAPA